MNIKRLTALLIIPAVFLTLLSSCSGGGKVEQTTTAEVSTNISDLISEDAKITEVKVLADEAYTRVFESDGNEYLFRVIKVMNVCDKTIDIFFSDTAYDSSGNMLDLYSAGAYAVKPQETVLLICSPISAKGVDHSMYSDPRDALSISESGYTSYTDKVSFSETALPDGIEVVATNNLDKLGSVSATVAVYKEGKLVDCQTSDLVNLANGQNDYRLSQGMSSEKTGVKTAKEFDSTEVYYKAVLENQQP